MNATSRWKIGAGVVSALLFGAATAGAAEHHVSPTGTPAGDGSAAKPWDLATALAGPASVMPGDTIWLHGGVYGNGGPAPFTSDLAGTEQQPIIVRQAPGERATINGGVAANGPWTWFWGFEITNTGTNRDVVSEANMPGARLGGLNMYGRGQKAINLIVHNTGHPAIGFWAGPGDGAEVYGCILWGNGIYDPTFPPPGIRGNGTYAQNKDGDRFIVDNISFRNFTEGLDAHSSGSGWVNGFVFQGNASFDNPGPALSTSTQDPANPMERLRILDNYTYRRTGDTAKATAAFGYYNNVENADITVQGNYFVVGSDDDRSVHIKIWKDVKVTGNTFVTQRYFTWYWPGLPGGAVSWDGNEYYFTGTDKPFILGPSPSIDNGSTFLDFTEWKTNTGFDKTSMYVAKRPSGLRVFKRPNKYDPSRAHVIVYNWDLLPSVDLDVSDLLQVGQRYDFIDAQNYFAPPVASGTYKGGSVIVSMDLTSVAPILGNVTHWKNQHTAPEFAVFVLQSDAPLMGGGSSSASGTGSGSSGGNEGPGGPSGCGCRVPSREEGGSPALLLGLLLLSAIRERGSRRRVTRS